jgi:MoaA/NifB/PqqE/SkfB family radical SAM enzyme
MPETIVFEATNRCDLECIHCNRELSGEPADISVDLVDKILDEAEPFRPRLVALSGGEPTLHGELEDLLSVIGQHDVEYTFTTNGQSFGHICEILTKAPGRFKGVTFSIDGSSPESHDRLRGDGSFERIVDALDLARRHGIPFGVNTVIGAHNAHELDDITRFSEESGADEISFILMRPTPQAVAEGLILSLEDAEIAERKVASYIRTRRKLKVGMATGYRAPRPFFPCRPLSMAVLSIDYRGYLRFCPEVTNYRGAEDDSSDVIADLSLHTLARSLKLLANRIALFQQHKIEYVMREGLLEVDYYPCFYCLRYFNKADCLDI